MIVLLFVLPQFRKSAAGWQASRGLHLSSHFPRRETALLAPVIYD
jgi:hypothetical protein